jgi:hypothetical protein
VVAVGEHGTRAPKNPVHGSREPRTERLHGATESLSAFGLDDQMRVIPLEGVMDEAKISAFVRARERTLELPHDSHRSQRGHIVPNLQCDVGGGEAIEPGARAMSDPRIRPRLPSGAGSSTATSDPIELELYRVASH